MATAAEVNAANEEFQAIVAEESTVSAEYEALRGPYLAKREQLNEVRTRLDAADKKMEQETADYTPPAAAQPE